MTRAAAPSIKFGPLCFLFVLIVLAAIMPSEFNKDTRAESYRRAVFNEIAVDETMYSAIGEQPETFGYLPRISAIWPRIKGRRKIAAISSRFAALIWRFGGYAAFFTGQCLLAFSNKARKSPETHINRRIEFSMSALAPALIAPERPMPNRLRLTSELLRDQLNDKVETLVPSQVLTNGEIFGALWESIGLTRQAIARDAHVRRWSFQTYTCFRWTLMARVLAKLYPSHVVMANHCDRWAILADDYARASGAKLTIVQHGLEARRHLPSRIQSVTELIVFSNEEATLFEDYVLSPDAARNVEIRVRQPILTTVPVPFETGDATPVLMVGHPNFDEGQRKIAEFYAERDDVCLIYKPHPTINAISPEIEKACIVWQNPVTFPSVPVVVAYYSTLAFEYELVGADVHVHGFKVGDHDLVAIDSLIKKHRTKGQTVGG